MPLLLFLLLLSWEWLRLAQHRKMTRQRTAPAHDRNAFHYPQSTIHSARPRKRNSLPPRDSAAS